MRKEEKQFNEVLLSWLEEIKIMRAPSTYVKYYRMSCKYISRGNACRRSRSTA